MAPEERFETVRTADRLAEVGPAWTDLWARSGALAFQSHAWVSACCSVNPSALKRR